MSGESERILDDLQKVLVEIEAVVKATLGNAGERASDGAEKLHSGLNRARAADSYVHKNAWVAIGVAAAAAFLLGVFAARRD
jgi:ElaB/YqjD/DUF883 family membrane-anchored ribosome-binding protein